MENRELKMKNNNKLEIGKLKIQGFTLVELMIVVAILGILAAIVLPEFQGHVQQAKEAAAKDNLRILREAIERYANDHNGVPPGYPGDDPSILPSSIGMKIQLVESGKYINAIPENPINGLELIYTLSNAESFPSEPVNEETYGWIYQPATKTVKLNASGPDSEGISYLDY
jgi:general secretion pathway protein G